MKLLLDNLDGSGPQDYSASLDSVHKPSILRRKNRPTQFHFSLLSQNPVFVVPPRGARVLFKRADGASLFTGYLSNDPEFEYLGWRQGGPAYRYRFLAISDEFLLDQKAIPKRHPFVARSAGDALRQLATDLLPGAFDTSGIADVDQLNWYSCNPQKSWSQHAAEIGLRSRGVYRAMDGKLFFASVGFKAYSLNESDPHFSSDSLKFTSSAQQFNQVTIIGQSEPQAHVKDYFVGDGVTSKFYLSQQPFTRSTRTLLDEEYLGNALDPTRWTAADPASAISVSNGSLTVAGGTGIDGQTTVTFGEQIELGGTLLLQHGEASFAAASDGVLGGLFAGAVSIPSCVAGFRISPSGSACDIQALVNGTLTGPVIATLPTHFYALTTRIYASEIYRQQQTFHSSSHPAGSGRGGTSVTDDVRIVLELHDIDPNSPASLIAPSTVLHDGVVSAAPDFCTYALISAANLHTSIVFTRMTRAIHAEVRSALPGQTYRTRLAGALSDGAECRLDSEPALQFFPSYIPAANEQIVARYRGYGVPCVQLTNAADVASRKTRQDDGVRAAVRVIQSPPVRTAIDCENAALAFLDDSAAKGWSGQYSTWSDFLPAADLFPGDALQVNAPSRNAVFRAIVQELAIEVHDLPGDHSRYTISFADEAAISNGLEFESNSARVSATPQTSSDFVPDLIDAEVTAVSSASITIDAGLWPSSGGGIEVRWSDMSWGVQNDRNLLARFTTRTFSVPRLGRSQNYFLRQYDSSGRYSRYSAALHVDYPL